MVGISMGIKYIWKFILRKNQNNVSNLCSWLKNPTKFNTMAFFLKILNAIIRNIKNEKKKISVLWHFQIVYKLINVITKKL
jgi:hypothetical protein